MAGKTDRTKAHISHVFLTMMAENGFEKITVAGLAKRAEINRGTFYHHFPDKYAILEELEEEIYREFSELMAAHVGVTLKEKQEAIEVAGVQKVFQDACYQITIYLYERKTAAQILVGENGHPQFIKRLEQLYIETVKKKLPQFAQVLSPQENLTLEFIFAGAIAIVKAWLRNGAQESPAEVAEILGKCMTTAPTVIFGELEDTGL